MNRSTKITALTIAVVLMASVAMRTSASAQATGADTHGVPPPAQLGSKDNQQTVPVKITTREYDLKKLLSAPQTSWVYYAYSA